MMKATLKDEELYQKEMLAQSQRAAALQFLEKNGLTPSQFERGDLGGLIERKGMKASTSSTDNTLELLRRNSALDASKARDLELQSKAAILQQQTTLREKTESKVESLNAPTESERKNLSSANPDVLPPGWKAVIDKSTGQVYYWNKSTNETSWAKPKQISVIIEPLKRDAHPVGIELPDGWSQHIHPATKQKYYKHCSGKTSSVHPNDIVDSKESASTSPSIDIIPLEKRKRVETDSQLKEKQRRLQIDPLDPMGGLGSWSSGIDASGKMADSTASGPLWQQRPYPAPSEALKGKDKPKSGVEAGPTLPTRNL